MLSIGSNFGFSILPEDTSTCRQLRPGIDPSTFWWVDDRSAWATVASDTYMHLPILLTNIYECIHFDAVVILCQHLKFIVLKHFVHPASIKDSINCIWVQFWISSLKWFTANFILKVLHVACILCLLDSWMRTCWCFMPAGLLYTLLDSRLFCRTTSQPWGCLGCVSNSLPNAGSDAVLLFFKRFSIEKCGNASN